MFMKQKQTSMLALSTVGLCLGLGLAFIDGKFTVISGFFSVAGFLGIVGFVLNKERHPVSQPLPLNKIRTFPLIALLGLLVFDGNYLSHRFNHRWDMTSNKQHTLSNETLQLISDLKDNISFNALYVGMPPKYLEDLLKEYAVQSKGRITFDIIDPIAEIGYAAQFGNVINGKESKVVVQSGKERKDIDFSSEPLTEELLNNAILSVTRHSRRVYFLKGHQEYSVFEDGDSGLKMFSDLLETNNFVVSELVIGLDGHVPADCDVLIIAGPKDDLTSYEEQEINAYLEKGGDALIMTENTVVTTPDKPLTKKEENQNPSLNNILRQWGIEVANDTVVDLANHAGKDVGSPATKSYMAHRAIVSSLDYTFYVRPRSIMMLSDRRKTIKLAPLVLTASEEQSWGETNRTLKVKYDEGIDRPGPVPIAYVISEPKEEKKISATRLIVFTDADFLTNVYIGSYSNAEMGLNVVYWLSDLDYQPLLGKKTAEVKRLDLTSRQKRQVIAVLIFLPVLILLGGMMVWMRKRS